MLRMPVLGTKTLPEATECLEDQIAALHVVHHRLAIALVGGDSGGSRRPRRRRRESSPWLLWFSRCRRRRRCVVSPDSAQWFIVYAGTSSSTSISPVPICSSKHVLDRLSHRVSVRAAIMPLSACDRSSIVSLALLLGFLLGTELYTL